MKSRIAWLAFLASTALSPAQDPAANAAPPAGAIEVNGIAAVVNGNVITKNKVGFMLSPVFAQLAAQFPRRGAEFERQVLEAREKILQELIDRQIIISEFRELEKKGANLKPQVIEQEIDRQIRTNYNGSEEKFEEELKRARMTRDGYRKMTREQLIVQAMRAEHFSDAPPPLPGEVAKEYAEMKHLLRDTTKDQITFNKIFLPRLDDQNPLATPESQLELAEKLAAEIKNGADIAELAKTHSRDAFADQGGYQENLPRTDLAPEFASIIFAGKEGDVIGPLEDPAGFTVVKIVDIKPGPSPSLGEVREQVEERVRSKKSSAAYEKWMEGRRRSAVIVRKL
ncbi:peptidylprolyl isomerase [Luteolibacter marinus]|uniref:peptidylprolyl isomerase n=1 Tax=Luteolibacter marinus TaxID=2776705 RepID=UPI001865AA19|nr:peptidylprolyl isomerase [Luteolibacter marinus]